MDKVKQQMATRDFQQLVAAIERDNTQMGRAEHIPNWHFHFKIKPASQGGGMSAGNIIKVDPLQRFLLLELQCAIYPRDKTLSDHFALLRDESFSTDAEEYAAFKEPVRLQYDIDLLQQAIAEHRGNGCDYGYEDPTVTRLRAQVKQKRELITQLREVIAEQARLYKPIIKQFPLPVAPHIAAMDRQFEAMTAALNPHRHAINNMGKQVNTNAVQNALDRAWKAHGANSPSKS